ncbi:MAG: carboxypeptidase M32 [Lachnospiraceae bacterium]|nr:carboxypeptidase M32 [Lachnospiraceae bacterium]
MSKEFDTVRVYIEKLKALESALVLFEWDLETLAPAGSVERTSKIIGALSEEYFNCLISSELSQAVYNAKASGRCSELETKILDKLEEEIDKNRRIPSKEYREFAELTSVSAAKWQEAKLSNDYDIFAPYLEKVVEFEKKFAGYVRTDEKTLYDVLLKDYEKGFDVERLDDFFDKLKKSLIPLVKNIGDVTKKIDCDFLLKSADIEKQKKFNTFLSEYLGFDFNRGVIQESEHPFTTSLHKDDVRITTHYYENNIESAIFSTIHETGHAIFEQGIGDDITMTPLEGGSCAVHESQSRMFENMIGRSKAFWMPLYEKLQAEFPGLFADVEIDKFVTAINRTQPSLIRTESDELTYSLHIIIRYEIEKELINGNLDVKKLPEIWNQKYEEYLGVKPEKYSEGILQDIHWSQGSIGYFPFYAVGNAIAAQIYAAMDKKINVEKCLEKKNIKKIREYLRENVHRYGMSKTADEFLKDITGEEFNPDYYIEYLTGKFTGLFM